MINHVKNICKIGQGNDCCRYLIIGVNGFECAKLTTMKELIDKKVITMTAQTDNCYGVTEITPQCE